MSDYRPVYYCDPDKNLECPKEACFIHGGHCRKTSRVDCARKDATGQPILDNLYSNANRCVCCGEIIPEGRQICYQCEHKGG